MADHRPGAPVVLRGHRGTVDSPDGRWLTTTSDDTIIRVWDWAGGGEPLLLRGHRATVWSVAFSPDGRWLASASDDGTVRIWDPRGAGDLVELPGHPGGAWSTAFRPSARRRGLATWALGRILDEARVLGLDRVLIACEVDNVSRRPAPRPLSAHTRVE